MEQRFEVRKQQLLDQAQVNPAIYHGALQRLESFVVPFASCLMRQEQRLHAEDFLKGLLTDLKHKNSEAIAYQHQHNRKELQHFIGQSQWDHKPLIIELAQQVGEQIGKPDAVIVFDPSAFPKQGNHSVGVKRQWCGRNGKVDNCQVGVYMGIVSAEEHALVNARLYLPKEWATDRKRRKQCHVPRHVRHRTRHDLSLEMLDEVGAYLPHAWIAGDDEMGRSSSFRRKLRERNEQYLLAVPCNTLVRDLQVEPPTYGGWGGKPKTPFVRADRWRGCLREDAWTQIDVRDGEKGPLIVEIVKCPVQAKTDRRRVGPEEVLVVIRLRNDQGQVMKHDYYLSNAPEETTLVEFSRVATAAHRIEECIKRGKSETGLGDYQVRSWHGWYHHQTLSLIAAWFVNTETRRGKKMDTVAFVPASSNGFGEVTSSSLEDGKLGPRALGTKPLATTQRTRPLLSLQTT